MPSFYRRLGSLQARSSAGDGDRQADREDSPRVGHRPRAGHRRRHARQLVVKHRVGASSRVGLTETERAYTVRLQRKNTKLRNARLGGSWRKRMRSPGCSEPSRLRACLPWSHTPRRAAAAATAEPPPHPGAVHGSDDSWGSAPRSATIRTGHRLTTQR